MNGWLWYGVFQVSQNYTMFDDKTEKLNFIWQYLKSAKCPEDISTGFSLKEPMKELEESPLTYSIHFQIVSSFCP